MSGGDNPTAEHEGASLMSLAPEPRPHSRHPARRLMLLALLLILALAVGWRAWSLTRTTTLPTATPKFTCTPADTHNQVLTSGSLTVKVLYGDVLRYVDDATRYPVGNLVALWTNDVLTPNPEFRSYMLTQQAQAVALSWASPDDFRCVVTDMERAHVGQMALQALEQSSAALSGPPATLDLVPWPISSNDSLLFDYVTGFSATGSIEVPCWEPVPSKRINSARAASQWVTYLPPAVFHEDVEVTRYALIGEPTAYATVQAFMITDGMADSFASARTHISLPWDHVFASAKQEQQIWTQIQPDLQAPGNYPQGNPVMLGDPAKGWPPDAGYTFGFHIVQDYLARHTNVSLAMLAGMSTATVFAGSGYTG
jgi:Predicted Zn-dependent protease (DUF2268)